MRELKSRRPLAVGALSDSWWAPSRSIVIKSPNREIEESRWAAYVCVNYQLSNQFFLLFSCRSIQAIY